MILHGLNTSKKHLVLHVDVVVDENVSSVSDTSESAVPEGMAYLPNYLNNLP